MLLCQGGITGCEQRTSRVCNQAADRALRNELWRMLEREMIIAAPPAVGSDAISEPMKGPLRSTMTDAATTMVAVIVILSRSPIRNIVMV